MTGTAARDPKVAAILNSPDEYFAHARRRAWLQAGEDIVRDLTRRAALRRRRPRATDRHTMEGNQPTADSWPTSAPPG